MASAAIDQRAHAQSRVRWELLTGLVRKDLKVKYQGSFLGFLWSLANPLVSLVVYTFFFKVISKNGIPQFGYFLLSGLLIWNLFTGSVGMASGAVVGNSGLVKKVRFPLDVLPLTPVGFNLVHFVLQIFVLLVAMSVTGDTGFVSWNFFLLLPALLVTLVLTIGLSYLVAALNVRYRDTQHIVEVVLMAAFWMSPIVYSPGLVDEIKHSWARQLYYLDPMTPVVVTTQRALYGHNPLANGRHVLASDSVIFYLEHLGVALVISALVYGLGRYVYYRLSADFAEEL